MQDRVDYEADFLRRNVYLKEVFGAKANVETWKEWKEVK